MRCWKWANEESEVRTNGMNLLEAHGCGIGLVNYLVEEDELIAKAIEISNMLCDSTAPISVAMTRHMLWSLSAEDNPENAHIIESNLINSRGASDDAKEGVMSFLEKRGANFKNKISSDLPNDFPWRKSQFKDN